MIDYKKCFICDSKLSTHKPFHTSTNLYECFDTPEHTYYHETGINYIYTYIGIWIEGLYFKLYLDSGYRDTISLSQNDCSITDKHLYRKEDSTLEEFELFANILKDKNINKLKKFIMIL